MDNLIKNKFGTISYVEILSNFPDYQHYLFQNTDLNQSFERIEEHLNMKLFVGDRQKKLNALIDGHFVLKKDIVEAKKHKLYQGFVEFNRGELNDVFHVIRTHVEKVNDCAKKSQKFNRELNKIVPVKYRALMVADPLCVNFHKHPVENFDDILDAIKAKIDLISKKEAFDKILMSKQLGPTEPYYTAYLQGLASKEETITNISSIPSNYLTLPEFTKYKNQLNKPDMQDTQLIDDTIFEFCNGSDDQLILEGFDGVERTYIHGLCDKLKLNHSKIKGRRNKDITISGKPFKKAMKFMDTATYYKKIDN
ncbi:MAG: hypothetical protein Hyperionvirus23_9 [Hyperionvirus sp.]|uniref:R3H domain-containing protein n=1 Tax=Hyperionvirus sp. TaxID=2487770 RepID=A0A3G5AB35_9VIRU|nr:MAG: hypothetical protein Hyperionvirus23_9 [Hyperionvirus sp.]